MNYKNCPNCENVGFFIVGDQYNLEQEQCQFCYTEPNSVFNVIKELQQKLEAAEAKYKALSSVATANNITMKAIKAKLDTAGHDALTELSEARCPASGYIITSEESRKQIAQWAEFKYKS